MGSNPIHLRAFFYGLAASANNLKEAPRFYHILRYNCTTVWIQQADPIGVNPLGFRLESVLNGLIAKLLLDKGAVETDLNYEEAKEKFRIDGKVLDYDGTAEFSDWIRR